MAATPRISSCNLHRFKLHFCSHCFIPLLCFYSSTTLLIVRFHKVCVALSLQMMVATLQCALLVVYKLNNRCRVTHHHRLWKRLLDCSLAGRYSLFKSWFQNWIPGGKFHTLFNYSQLTTNGTILLGCWCWSSELRSVQVTSWWEKAVLYFFYLLYASGAFPGIWESVVQRFINCPSLASMSVSSFRNGCAIASESMQWGRLETAVNYWDAVAIAVLRSYSAMSKYNRLQCWPVWQAVTVRGTHVHTAHFPSFMVPNTFIKSEN